MMHLSTKGLYSEYVSHFHNSVVPVLGKSPGGGQSISLQYCCLVNPHGEKSLMGYSPWGHKESDMSE